MTPEEIQEKARQKTKAAADRETHINLCCDADLCPDCGEALTPLNLRWGRWVQCNGVDCDYRRHCRDVPGDPMTPREVTR